MKGRYLKALGGLFLTALMVVGIAFVSADSVQAQRRRRVVIVRPYPYRIYRPFGYRGYWYDPWYDPFSPYGSYYRHYIFSNSENALNQGYKDGFKTGKDDGKKDKSVDPERSHYYQEAGFGNFAEAYRSGFVRGYQDGYRTGERAG